MAYYDAGAPVEKCDAVFAACYRLTRYRYWREELAPGLNRDFWGRKGVLPVLLTFKQDLVIGSGSRTPHEVLAAALTRGRQGEPTLQRLFLLAWKGHLPSVTPNQAVTTDPFYAMPSAADRFRPSIRGVRFGAVPRIKASAQEAICLNSKFGVAG